MGKATSIRTQRQKMEAKEQAILNAARAEFSAMGVEGAKMSAIAKRASVAEGTVYLYYRNKKELLDAVVSSSGRTSLGAPKPLRAKIQIQFSDWRLSPAFISESSSTNLILLASRCGLEKRERSTRRALNLSAATSSYSTRYFLRV